MYRTLRNPARLLRICLTLARYDALFPLERVGLAPFVVKVARVLRRRRGIPGRPGERLAAALQELGPTFIKMGQMLSTRPDLMGEGVASDLAKLQDKLPPFPGVEAREIVEEEMGAPIAEMFSAFELNAVAAASIAQVHFAVTSAGEEVAVKVLRPNIEAAFARDLDLFYWLARIIHRTRPDLRRLKPIEVVRTFAESVQMEMDLRLEAAAATELAENFVGDETFRVPKIDWERTGKRMLTLERIRGIPVDQRQALIEAGHDPNEILSNAAAVFFNQVFRDGFFHADQHPGNAFVDENGTIVAIDFGIMGRLDRKHRYYLADMLVGFLRRDYELVADVHFRAGFVPPHKSRDAFTQSLRAIAEPIMDKPQHEISVAKLLGLLFQVTETFEMETQPQLLLLQKTMLVTEGVGRKLNPDVNMWTMSRPLIESWIRRHRGPEARAAEAARSLALTVGRLPDMLENVDRALERLAAEPPPRTVPEAPVWPYWIVISALVVALVIAVV